MLANAAYVAAWPSATLFYVANVVLHLLLGSITVVWLMRREAKFAPLAIAALLGVYLIFRGAVTENRWIVTAHIAFAIVGLTLLLPRLRVVIAVLTIAAGALRWNMPERRI